LQYLAKTPKLWPNDLSAVTGVSAELKMNRENLKRKSDARERLVKKADQLFYAEGVHAVGIDRIIKEASVAKMTLYNHFRSKDDLILAVLQQREENLNEMFSKSIAKHARKGKSRLEAFFLAMKDWFRKDDFRGCSFINTTIELADNSHAASKFSASHKKRFHRMIGELVAEEVGAEAKTIAPAISLLAEGAIVAAVIQQSAKPADTAREAALALIPQKLQKHK
jgi:AcrR family transcriptional regulator